MSIRSKIERILLGFAVMFGISVTVLAAETVVPDKVYARTNFGIVRSLDSVNHIAVISGYKYEFGALQDGWMAEVKMYDSEFGSFEMLRVGMKVKVVYGELGFTRVVLRLKQLADDTIIPLE